jgi:hypothetical protein
MTGPTDTDEAPEPEPGVVEPPDEAEAEAEPKPKPKPKPKDRVGGPVANAKSAVPHRLGPSRSRTLVVLPSGASRDARTRNRKRLRAAWFGG